MKKSIRTAVLPLAAALLLTVTACTAEDNAEEEAPLTEAGSAQSQVIATLEAELQKEREDRYISEYRYKTQIKELQQQLAALTTGTPDGDESVLHYRVENGGAVITGYSGSATLLTIPQTLDGYPVTALGERAFENSSIAGVVLPEGIHSIGWFAFYGCSALVSVTLPQSVSSIGYAVFDGCKHLSLICPADSYAEQYAKSYGIPCTQP